MTLAIPMLDIAKDRLRGLGHLCAQRAEKKISLPLSGVKISAKVAEQIATVTLIQTFQNSYSDHLEAVYIFPLPGGAAISNFELKVANRHIRGRVEERGEARRQYQQALDEGKRAAIMEKERDDVFTVQVGNIPPNEEVSVQITYSERLVFFEEGTTELRLPLVVAPRYTPGQGLMRDQVGDGVEQDTYIVPDASRISPPRLAKGFDPKVGLGIDVTIFWGDSEKETEIKDLCCSQHATRTSAGRDGVKISLAKEHEALDRDFVLRWTVSGATLRSSLLVYQDANQFDNPEMYYGMLSLLPPKNQSLSQARDIVFIVDRSGSMQGVKIASAARACALLLTTLGTRDRFAIQAYSSHVDWYKPSSFSYGVDGYFMPADYWGLEQGEKYLRAINADGGTETFKAISAAISALEGRQDKEDRVPVIVLLTDGEVSNEAQIFHEVQTRLGNTRLFTIGIDTAVNQGFLQRLAEIGRATSTFVTPGAQLETALVTVGREIGNPLIVDLKILDIDSDVQLSTVAPSKITDLFVGRSTTTFFMLKKAKKVCIKGKYANGEGFETVVEAKEVQIPAISQLWAKTRITDLEDWYRINPGSQEDLKKQIVSLSIKHNILTRFTAFIAVDHEEIANKEGISRKVVQPVEMPAQWQEPVASYSLNQNTTAGGFYVPHKAPSAPMPTQAPSAPAYSYDNAHTTSSAGGGLRSAVKHDPGSVKPSVAKRTSALKPEPMAQFSAPKGVAMETQSPSKSRVISKLVFAAILLIVIVIVVYLLFLRA
jgi:Ca-activated chloride channel family protein